MIGPASIFGFTLGVAIGAIAAASTASELRSGANEWASGRRWEVLRDPSNWKPSALLGTILSLHRLEFLVVLSCLWIAGLVLAIFVSPSWSEGASAIRYFAGSLVGAAAAPWIWLHFSRNFDQAKNGSAKLGKSESGSSKQSSGENKSGKQGDDDKKTDKAAESEQFARYRFVTFMLAAALLVAVLQPYLDNWFRRTSSIGVLGVSLVLTPRNELGTPVSSVGTSSTQSSADTAQRLSKATTAAHLVASGKRPKGEHGAPQKRIDDVDLSLKGFSDLSMMDRDKIYIAYFLRELDQQRAGSTRPALFKSLKEYVTVPGHQFKQIPDQEFLESLNVLSECVARYAEEVRDFRLFLIDSNNFLRALLVDVAAPWSRKKANQDKGAAKKVAAQQSTSRTLRLEANDKFATQVVTALGQSNADDPRKTCVSASALTDRVKNVNLDGIGKTPYPAYLIAHYMAAIDSVESGVLVLQDWIAYQSKNVKERDAEQDWYTVRAMLAASQLPYRYGSVSPSHAALVQFQQATTDRIGALLGLQGAQTWRSLCAKLGHLGLHAQIGRYLALTYADERNYLYELLLPEDFGLPRDSSLKIMNESPATFLEEAEAMLATPDCFAGVPSFNQKLIALFHLNAAQLRYAVRASTTGLEKAALTRKIVLDLERAKPLEAPDDPRAEGLDLLRQPGENDRHRARLARFRKILDNESEKD
jgi:hypothetical protein